MGRAIVSYTGEVGTEYTDDGNVDFWELKNCGNNAHIIRDASHVRNVGVGDILFMKGTKWPTGASGATRGSNPGWPADSAVKSGQPGAHALWGHMANRARAQVAREALPRQRARRQPAGPEGGRRRALLGGPHRGRAGGAGAGGAVSTILFSLGIRTSRIPLYSTSQERRVVVEKCGRRSSVIQHQRQRYLSQEGCLCPSMTFGDIWCQASKH